MRAPTEEPFGVVCRDGVRLRGTLLLPTGRPRAAVQFNPGTAAKLRFYRPFLDYLAGRGFAVAAYDNRGTGASRPAEGLRDAPYRYLDYGTLDAPAVLNYLRGRLPKLPLLVTGHSAGGQQFALMAPEDYGGVRGALFFAVSTGYGPGMATYYRPQAWAFWHLIGPAAIAATGYGAFARLGLMEDLPAGVYRDWRRWCRSPDYFFDARFGDSRNALGESLPQPAWTAMDFPVRHVHAPTDEISSRRNVSTFWRHWHPAGGVEQVVLDPRDYGGAPVRHFDYFRRRFRENLWAEAADWLAARVA